MEDLQGSPRASLDPGCGHEKSISCHRSCSNSHGQSALGPDFWPWDAIVSEVHAGETMVPLPSAWALSDLTYKHEAYPSAVGTWLTQHGLSSSK